MYETFYHLSATPFRLTPDPKFCFSHSGYEQAHAYLQYAFELGEGFILLTGRPGAGKTTLIETFLGELEAKDAVTARVVVSHLESTDLLRSVAYRYEVEAEGLDKATLLKRITEFFSRQKRLGRRVLLVIDEAQGLSHSSLEELRLMADLQERGHPLLQIFLVGQESLRDVMREPRMEQFQQRVIGTCRLGPMSLAETRSYVEHRLRRASWTGDPELTGPSILAIYRYSAGVPRHVNKICTRLLLQGVLENKHKLDKDDVVGIAMEMDDEQLAPTGRELLAADETSSDAMLESELPEDSPLLSQLAVRMERQLGDTPPVPQRFAAATTRQSPTECASHHPVQRDVARQRVAEVPVSRSGGFARGGTMPPGVAVAPMGRRRHNILKNRVLPGVFKFSEKPALLFSAVAVATLSAGALTSLFGDRGETDQRALFVTEAQPIQAPMWTRPKDESPSAPALQPGRRELGPENTDNAAAALSAERQIEAGVAAVGAELLPGESTTRSGALVAEVAVVESVPVRAASETAPGPETDGDASGNAKPAPAGSAANAQLIDAVTPAGLSTTAASEPAAAATQPDRAVSDGRQETARLDAKAQKVARLLLQGRTALGEDRLMIPATRSAHYYFQQMLVLEPDNWEALFGLSKIVDRYVELATGAVQRGDEIKARRYIARGLRVRSQDTRLLALRDRLDASPGQAQPPVTVAVQAVEPVVEPVEEPEKPKNVVEWLKDFLSRNAAESRRDSSPE
jgi:type II secretory pathway predicted ATPase ExeA